jgi:oxygen-independent coproporphyrinogen-3 oxidase
VTSRTLTAPLLYVHFPFCESKCGYCDFASIADRGPELRASYLAALLSEIERAVASGATLKPVTLFFGGGTPSMHTPDEWRGFLARFVTLVDLSRVAEWTCEANPSSLTQEHLDVWRDAGVTRVSIGVQSFNHEALRVLERVHDPAKAAAACALLRDSGLAWSLDLIYGVPGCGADVALADLDRALSFAPSHLSAYNLIVEPGTPFHTQVKRGAVRMPDEDDDLAIFDAVFARMRDAGFTHYEVSNWAKPGHASRHNLGYWLGAAYAAFGVSGAGYDGATRDRRIRVITDYINRVQTGADPVIERSLVSSSARIDECLLGTLRTAQGLTRRRFEDWTGLTLPSEGFRLFANRSATVAALSDAGALVLDEDRVHVPDAAWVTLDSAILALSDVMARLTPSPDQPTIVLRWRAGVAPAESLLAECPVSP